VRDKDVAESELISCTGLLEKENDEAEVAIVPDNTLSIDISV
jgi:hypothetical protein